jgi:hypothetical protein
VWEQFQHEGGGGRKGERNDRTEILMGQKSNKRKRYERDKSKKFILCHL